MTVYEEIQARAELAVTYAEDGAYRSALRILEEITERVRLHVAFLESEGM